jgi:hypothetical protein
MIFFNLNNGLGSAGIVQSSSLEIISYITISLLSVLMLSILYNFISKNQSTNIENEDLGTPIYRDLDILLQEKPIHNNSQEFIPELPLKTQVTLFTKIILIALSLLMIFNSFGQLIYSYSELIFNYF